MMIFALAIFVALVVGFVVCFFQFPYLYFQLTHENHFGEWVQFSLFLVGAVIFAQNYLRSPGRTAYAVMAFALFFIAMEEISWGQQIFNWISPQFFDEKNLQSETNLHNFIIGAPLGAAVILFKYTLASSMVLYGTLYPFLVSRQWAFFELLNHKVAPAPPIYLAPFFIVAGLGSALSLRISQGEIAETFIGFAMVLFAVTTSQNTRKSRSALLVLCCSMVIALMATTLYTNSNIADERSNATASGKYHLSKRYFEMGLFDQAKTMAVLAKAGLPSSIKLLHLMFQIDFAREDEAAAIEHLVNAALIGETRTANDPMNIEAGLLNAKTLQFLGDDAVATEQLEDTLRKAEQVFQENPNNPVSVYQLAQAHEANGNIGQAIRFFEIALSLDPNNRAYLYGLIEVKNLPK